MPTFLLTWSKWQWEDFSNAVSATTVGEPYKIDWTVHAFKAIQPGDRVFLMRLGAQVRRRRSNESAGIIASGWVTIAARQLPHYNPDRRTKGDTVHKIGVAFDFVLPREHVLPEHRLPLSKIRSTFSWTPENSGLAIPEDAAAELERIWIEWVVAKRQDVAGSDWEPDELGAIVSDYFDMLDAELRGEDYVKAQHRKELIKRIHGRSEAAIEFKHRNISAVLAERKLPCIVGYRPASNYQDALADAVERYLTENSEWIPRAEQVDTQQPTAEAWRIENIVVPPPLPDPRMPETGRSAPARQIDYLAFAMANNKLGKAGEVFVVDLEKRYLREHGRPDLADRIEHVSETRGDGVGYDILSFDEHGNEKFIEVKTTNLGPRTPFYVSGNEVRISFQESSRYWLYRVYAYSRAPHLFMVQGALTEKCNLEPAAFVARVAR